MCKYREPYNLANELVKYGILSDNKCTQSYLHLNRRGISLNWEKFKEVLCDMHSDLFSFDYIITKLLLDVETPMTDTEMELLFLSKSYKILND